MIIVILHYIIFSRFLYKKDFCFCGLSLYVIWLLPGRVSRGGGGRCRSRCWVCSLFYCWVVSRDSFQWVSGWRLFPPFCSAPWILQTGEWLRPEMSLVLYPLSPLLRPSIPGFVVLFLPWSLMLLLLFNHSVLVLILLVMTGLFSFM